jgi:hypothetical protein
MAWRWCATKRLGGESERRISNNTKASSVPMSHGALSDALFALNSSLGLDRYARTQNHSTFDAPRHPISVPKNGLILSPQTDRFLTPKTLALNFTKLPLSR